MLPFFLNKSRITGVLEKIELTFGSRGHQLMTIDGVQYATWIDYKQWPKIGDTVSFQTYREYGMLCATDMKIEKQATPPVL